MTLCTCLSTSSSPFFRVFASIPKFTKNRPYYFTFSSINQAFETCLFLDLSSHNRTLNFLFTRNHGEHYCLHHPALVRYRWQCLANYSCQSCRPSECPRSGALRMYHTKEMGRQLGIHGFLRFCRNFDLLVVWAYRMGFNGYLSLVFLVPSSVLTRYFNKHRSQQPISIPISHFLPWLISSSSSPPSPSSSLLVLISVA